MIEQISYSDYRDKVAAYFAYAVRTSYKIFVAGKEVDPSSFQADQLIFDSREFHHSNRVNDPTAKSPGGLDELITFPRLKNVLMIRIGSADPIPMDPEKYDWREHVQTIISHDPDRGTIVYHKIAFPKVIYDLYYEGLINGFHWPLNHERLDIAKQPYTTGLFDSAGREVFKNDLFQQHVNAANFVNRVFADFTKEVLDPVQFDSGRIHDAHLYPQGRLLRERNVDCPLAFFLHTPAPSHDLYGQLPRLQQQHVRSSLLSLYAYDHVGVQADRDLERIWDIIGQGDAPKDPDLYKAHPMTRKDIGNLRGNIDCRFLSTDIGVYPVVGHNALYAAQAAAQENLDSAERFLYGTGIERPTALTWGRCDYSKGGVNQSLSLDLAITNHGVPAHHLRFLQQAALGRQGVPAFKQEFENVLAANCELMEKHGQAGLLAYLYTQHVDRPTLLALARMTGESEFGGLGIITPLADGFNLVATEWLAAQNRRKPGVLILGKNAGASKIIGDAALLVDSTSPEDTAEAVARGYEMQPREREDRHEKALTRMNKFTNDDWRDSISDDTQKAFTRSQQLPGRRIYYSGANPG